MRDRIILMVLLLWAVPMALFWGWYALSVNDLNFGTIYLSRELNDAVFAVYGKAIGVSAGEVPALIAGACLFDSGLVGAIVAWRLRRKWMPGLSGFVSARYDVWRGAASGAATSATGFASGRVPPAE